MTVHPATKNRFVASFPPNVPCSVQWPIEPDPLPLYQCLFPLLLEIVVTLVALPRSIDTVPVRNTKPLDRVMKDVNEENNIFGARKIALLGGWGGVRVEETFRTALASQPTRSTAPSLHHQSHQG